MKTIPRVLSNVPVLRVLRVFRNVPVFVAFLLVLTAAAPLFAQAPLLPPGITQQQIEEWKQMQQSGMELPPEAMKLLEARPDLKELLAAEAQKEVEGEGKEKGKE